MPDYDFEKELPIDKFALDEDALCHAERAGRWIRLATEAMAIRDKAKEALEYIEANLDLDVRKQWEIYNPGIKMTEGGITSTIRVSKAYVDASAALLAAERDYSLLKGACAAFQQRKDMIEDLTKLYLGGYFSRPVVPEESRYAATKKMEAVLGENIAANVRVQEAASKRRVPPPPPSETAKPLPGQEGGE